MAVAAAVAPAVPHRPSLWQTILLAVPALAAVACLGGVLRFLIWTSGRGLDLTDEGYYFIAARHPSDAVMTVTASHRLLSPLFAAVGWNIPIYRVIGFCLSILAAFVLAAGLDALRRRLDPAASRSWTYVAAESAVIALGSLLGNSWLLTSPSYNTITNWGLSFGAGAVLVALAIGESNRAASVWLGLLGVTLGVMFFAKATAAVAAGAVFIAVMLAWPLAPFGVRARWVLWVAAGFVAFDALYFLVLQSPGSWLSMLRLGLWDAATQSPLHGSKALPRYWLEWRNDVVVEWLKDFRGVFAGLTALAVAIVFVPARSRAGLGLRAIAWAGIAYAVYLGALHVRDYPPVLYQYDVTRFFFGWLLLLGPLAMAWGTATSFRLPASSSRLPAFAWTLVVVMLFVLPFCGAVGTGNPLQYGMRYMIASWFALFALMLGRLSAPARTRWAVPAGLAILSAYCAVYLVKGPLEAPYRLLTGLRGQTVDTPIGESVSILKLDPELHDFITGVRKAAQDTGFKPGDDILGLFDMPGIVYALGGRSPGVTWWTMGYPGSRTVMNRAIELAGAERLRRTYILQTKSSTEWLESLKPLGVNFPDDYELGGTFTIPFAWTKEEVKWWRPKSR